MKPILILMLAMAAHAATRIDDTIHTGFPPQVFRGRVTVQGPAMTTTDNRFIARWTRDFQLNDGHLVVDLEPNDTATPAGTSYYVIYRPQSGVAWSEYWVVPTSTMPLAIAAIRVPQPPAPQMTVQPTQISSGGAAEGQCLAWTGAAWAPAACGGGDHPVTSVFGRTGAVTAQPGDYSFGQIGGAVTNPQLAAGVDAAKIASGVVDNAEFSRLDGVTANIQGQFQQRPPMYICDADTADGVTYSCVTGHAVAPYEWMLVYWRPNQACTGPPQLSVDGAPARPVRGPAFSQFPRGLCNNANTAIGFASYILLAYHSGGFLGSHYSAVGALSMQCGAPGVVVLLDASGGLNCDLRLVFESAVLKSPQYGVTLRCAGTGSPLVCGDASAGALTIGAGTVSKQVMTSAITASSHVIVTLDASLGSTLGVSCNADAGPIGQVYVSSRTSGSFTAAVTGTVSGNPACVSFLIVH